MHSLLVVRGRQLVSVVERADVAGADDHVLVAGFGCLTGRTVGPTADLETVRVRMLDLGLRRLAVVDRANALLGLLCLKRSGAGFCSDEDVSRRATGLPH